MIIYKIFLNTLAGNFNRSEWEGAKVNLMTMHAAKGLSLMLFSFLVGKRFVSSSKSLEEKGDFALEEERRLAYVGITRAKKRLIYLLQ